MGSPIVKALLGALLVFALPIVTPQSTLPFGAALAMGWMEGRPPLRLAAEVVLALLAHDAAFGVGWWYFRGPNANRRFLYMAAFPLLWLAISWAYLTAIPQYFQEDAEDRPAIDWRAGDSAALARGPSLPTGEIPASRPESR